MMASRAGRANSLYVECRREGSTLVPVRFGLRGSEREVAEVLDSWPGKDHLYFKLRTTDGDLYILRFDAARAEWEITVFRAEAADGR